MSTELLRIRGPLSSPELVENQVLDLCHLPDRRGRMRWWVRCPQCGMAVRIVYSLTSGVFYQGQGFPLASPRCHGLTYASCQLESGQSRNHRTRVAYGVLKGAGFS